MRPARSDDEASRPHAPRTEVAAAVVVEGDRVLVQTRPAGRTYAGWWEFPGGKQEPDEDGPACAQRECREELGLAVRVLQPLHTVAWEYPGARVRVTFYLCAPAPGAAPPEPVEGQELRWADVAALAELRFLPANAEVLELLRARLGRDATDA